MKTDRQRNTGMAPTIDSRNILRPETVESLYIAFQLTGDRIYREWGWQIFQSFQRWCQVDNGDGGYAGIDDVDNVDHKQIDRMETYVSTRHYSQPSAFGFPRLSSTYICFLPGVTNLHSMIGSSTRRHTHYLCSNPPSQPMYSLVSLFKLATGPLWTKLSRLYKINLQHCGGQQSCLMVLCLVMTLA